MMNNKLIIPALLIAAVMVAGLFAFAPVEQASTVHDTVSGDLDDLGQLLCNELYAENYNPATEDCVDTEG